MEVECKYGTIVGGSGDALGNTIAGGGTLTLTPGTNVYWYQDTGKLV